MKKRLLLPLLAAGALVGIAAAGNVPGRTLAGPGTTHHALEEGEEAIVLSLPPEVTAEAPEGATPGEIVHVDISYEEGDILVHALLVNGNPAAEDPDGGYYFPMPGEGATITLAYDYVGKYEVNDISAEGIALTGLPEGLVREGDAITFAVHTLPGTPVSFTGVVTIEDAEGNDVPYTKNGNEYSFEMPDSDVTILCGTETRLFRVNEEKYAADDTSYDLILNYGVLGEEGSVEDITYKGAALAGSTIRVTMQDATRYRPTGIQIKESGATYMLEEGSLVLDIPLPNHDMTLVPLAELKYLPFQIECPEGVTAKAYTKDGTGAYQELTTLEAVPQDLVYLKAESESPDVKVTGWTGTYLASWGSGTIPSVRFEDVGDGYWSYEMDDEEEIVLTPTTIDRMDVALPETEDVEIALYAKGADGQYVLQTGFFPGDTVYAKATLLNEEVRLESLALLWKEGYYDGEIEMTLNEEGYYEGTIDPSATGGYAIEAEIVAPFDVTLTNSLSLTGALYGKTEAGAYEAKSSFFPGETVYVQVSGETEDLKVRDVLLGWYDEGYYTWSDPEPEDLSMTLNDDGYYEGTIPAGALAPVSVTILEENPTAYAAYPFVGSYEITEGYSDYYNSYDEEPTNGNITVPASGIASFRGTEAVISSVEGDPADDEGIIHFADGKILAYGTNVIFTDYGGFDSLEATDVYWGLKTQDDGATYTCSLLNVRGGGSSYAGLFQGYRTDADGSRTTIAAGFYFYQSGSPYQLHLSGVECKDAEGNAVELPKASEEDAEIHVYVDGAKIGVMTRASKTNTWTPAE